MKYVAIACIAVLAASVVAGNARAEEKVTVQWLLQRDYQVVGSIFNPPAGAGVFLQKKDSLYLCLLFDAAGASTITTTICKPVH